VLLNLFRVATGGAVAQRDAIRHLEQPAADRLTFADGAGLAGEDEEGGLEGVLGVVRVAKETQTEIEYHRPVPPDEDLERRLLAAADERFQQLGVGQRAAAVAADEPAQLLGDTLQRRARHVAPSSEGPLSEDIEAECGRRLR